MYLKNLINSKKTVFTVTELKNLFALEDSNYTRVLISRMVKRGELQRVYQGIYTYKTNYHTWELANKIKTPSYVSLESVLVKAGVVFQDYGQAVFSVSSNTVIKTVSNKEFSAEFHYHKIKGTILSNPEGIEFGQVIQASPERAVCDRIYLTSNYYFDNLEFLNKKKLLKLAKIYNKRVYREVESLC